MINGLEGIPGSGKSYEAVVFHVLHALSMGRLVITNLPLNVEAFAAIDPAYRQLLEFRTAPMPIRGYWDRSAVGTEKPLFIITNEAATLEGYRGTVFGGVWDYYSEWRHPTTSAGPLFVIDECHVALPKTRCDEEVIQWFKMHRHFNCDVLLMTQRFRGVEEEIAGLMGMLIRVRKADILGKPDSYIRKVHGGYRGAVISTEERKYQPQFFPLYRSHTQGNSVSESLASDVSPFIVKFKRFSYVFYAVTAAALIYAFVPGCTTTGKKAKPVAVARAASHPVAVVASAASAASSPASAASAADPNAVPDPYRDKGLHLVGMLTMPGRTLYTVAVATSGLVQLTVTSEELERNGFKFEAKGDCFAVLRWPGAKPRTLVCDVPRTASGTESRPVVVMAPPAVVAAPPGTQAISSRRF